MTRPLSKNAVPTTIKKQLALAKSPLGRLVNDSLSPLLELMTPLWFKDLVQRGCTKTKGGVECVAFRVGQGLPEDEQPKWLLKWNEDMCSDSSCWWAGCAQACAGQWQEAVYKWPPGVLNWAVANGCEWNSAYCKQAAADGLQGAIERPPPHTRTVDPPGSAPIPIPKISDRCGPRGHRAIIAPTQAQGTTVLL